MTNFHSLVFITVHVDWRGICIVNVYTVDKLFISTEKGESWFVCNPSLSITHLECHITKCVCLRYQLQRTSSTLLLLLLDLDVKFRNKVCYLASGRIPTQLETHGMMPATKG